MLLAATFQQAVAMVLVLFAIGAWIFYLIYENAGGRVTPKTNVDSFLGAPNRKTPPDDEEYEGKRLDRTLTTALVSMTAVAISLPMYWLGEPGRQEGAIRGFDKRAVNTGERLFSAEHAEEAKPAGLACLNCHGAEGKGGVAPWNLPVLDADGQPVKDAAGRAQLQKVKWTAPNVATVGLRYQPDQIRAVLIYGRGGNKPMPAWGVAGGGPSNDQAIEYLVQFLRHKAIEESPAAKAAYDKEWKKSHKEAAAYDKAIIAAGEENRKESTKALEEYLAGEGKGKSEGEAIFNLNCARCHTKGYSYGQPEEQGGGFYGPNLRGGSTTRQFPNIEDQIAFVKNGAAEGAGYGKGGVQSYRGGGMPYFANTLPDEQIEAVVKYVRGL